MKEGAPEEKSSGPREGLILLLFTVLTLAATTYVLISAEQDAVDDPVEKAARGEINGLDDLSLFREKNFQRVLDDIAERSRPLITSLRLDPERVNAVVRDEDGTRKVLNVNAGYEIDESDFGAGEDEFLHADDIDAGAPERMIRQVLKRTGLDADDVDYVSLAVSGDSWGLYADTGPARDRQWTAAADGSDVRRPGDPSREQRARQECFERADGSQDIARCSEKFDS